MIRRKLFAYTAMMAAGIVSGYFIVEKARLFSGICFMVTAAVITAIAPAGERDSRRERRILEAALAAGFLIFTARYISFSCAVIPVNNYENGYREYIAESDEGYAVSAGISEKDIVSIEGRCMYVSHKSESLRIMVTDVTGNSYDGRHVRIRCNVLASTSEDIEPPDDMTGRRIRISGKLSIPSERDNPGCFDYRLYLRSLGTGYVMKADYTEVSYDKHGTETAGYNDKSRYRLHLSRSVPAVLSGLSGHLSEKRWGIRRSMIRRREKFLGRISDEENRAFVKGVIFGDKSDIDEETIEEFNMNATGHVLAVSGLHVGFLYGLLRALSGKRRSRLAAAAVIAVLVMYGEMTLQSPSAERAIAVMSINVLSIHFRRPFDLLSAVSAAAAWLLVCNPYQLFNTGFQMSFLALLGISFMVPPLKALCGESMAVMLAVQLASAPLTAFTFHRFNAVSIFINVPVIFISSILVPAAMLMLPFAGFRCLITDMGYSMIEGLSEITVRLNRILASDGWFSGSALSVNTGVLAGCYLIMFFITSEWFRIRVLRKDLRRILCMGGCILAITASAAAASLNSFSNDGIVFVSVGQGDCTHIRIGGHDVLIDGGGSTFTNVGEKILMPYLLSNGADNVDMALVTHLHTDHYLGISELTEVYPVGCTGIPSDYRRAAEEAADDPDSVIRLPGKIRFVSCGDMIHLTDDVFIEPVWPPPGRHSGIDLDDPNENNMVYIVSYKGVKVMVTGDLLEEDELEMISYYHGTDVLKCSVLKVGHHGSKTSSSEAFLDAVSPDIAVIQAGRNNIYGHPHSQTLERLEERGIRVYRTDLNGAVGLEIRRGRIAKVDIVRDSAGLIGGGSVVE